MAQEGAESTSRSYQNSDNDDINGNKFIMLII